LSFKSFSIVFYKQKAKGGEKVSMKEGYRRAGSFDYVPYLRKRGDGF
jgi:hypothetical protein